MWLECSHTFGRFSVSLFTVLSTVTKRRGLHTVEVVVKGLTRCRTSTLPCMSLVGIYPQQPCYIHHAVYPIVIYIPVLCRWFPLGEWSSITGSVNTLNHSGRSMKALWATTQVCNGSLRWPGCHLQGAQVTQHIKTHTHNGPTYTVLERTGEYLLCTPASNIIVSWFTGKIVRHYIDTASG